MCNFLVSRWLFSSSRKTLSEALPSSCKKKIDDIDFSMNADVYEDKVDSWFSTCFSITLKIFHGTIFSTIIIIIVIIAATGGK